MKNLTATEIRVGNWVNAEVGLPSLQYHKILAKDFNYIFNESVYVYGIPLTEEILLKCGFSEDDLSSGKILINHINGKDTGFIIRKYTSSIVISTLHQLQNIHFALTNEELTINL